MKFLDLLGMSIGNLSRRRLRTFLTVLGVIIGTASVVSMVSFGIGLNELQIKMIEQYGSLRTVTVRSQGFYDKSSKKQPKFIKDDVIRELSKLNNVTVVYPSLSTNVILKQGVWENNTEVKGVPKEYLKNLEYRKGSADSISNKEITYAFGNMVRRGFSNSKTGANYYSTGKDPDVDLENKSFYTIFDTETYMSSQSGSMEPGKTPAKKYLSKGAAFIKGAEEDYNMDSYSIYMDIDLLKSQLKKIYKNKAVPGQPTQKNGKPYKYLVYDVAIVYVDTIKHVTDVQKKIQEMGYQAESNAEWLEQSKQQSRMLQGILGGIGAISLFVAAIGIANTMMMSIYERTKEIGIMKVLGCDMGKIRNMFLIESGLIGFLGGVVGLIISGLLAFVVNNMGIARAIVGEAGGRISVIPPWLALASIIFAILIGMMAGFFPAMRAMRLSPLSALRNE